MRFKKIIIHQKAYRGDAYKIIEQNRSRGNRLNLKSEQTGSRRRATPSYGSNECRVAKGC